MCFAEDGGSKECDAGWEKIFQGVHTKETKTKTKTKTEVFLNNKLMVYKKQNKGKQNPAIAVLSLFFISPIQANFILLGEPPVSISFSAWENSERGPLQHGAITLACSTRSGYPLQDMAIALSCRRLKKNR